MHDEVILHFNFNPYPFICLHVNSTHLNFSKATDSVDWCWFAPDLGWGRGHGVCLVRGLDDNSIDGS